MIDYAEKPDKTTDPKYLDDDLRRVLAYTENDQKTDRRMFVSTLNCSKQDPYEDMMATYWAHKNGQLTHRDILRRDVDEAIAHCATYNSFTRYLRGLGYEFRRDAHGT